MTNPDEKVAEESEQQEKFEFLKEAAIAIHAASVETPYFHAERACEEASKLAEWVWKYKGKL